MISRHDLQAGAWYRVRGPWGYRTAQLQQWLTPYAVLMRDKDSTRTFDVATDQIESLIRAAEVPA
jgi:hypothetical protein